MNVKELNTLIDKVTRHIHIEAMGSTTKSQFMENSAVYTIPEFNGVSWYTLPLDSPVFNETEKQLLNNGFVPLGRLENGIMHSRVHPA